MNREEQVDKALKSIPIRKAVRFCRSGACGCRGCVNFTMQEHDISEAEWVYWKKVNRKYIRDGLATKEKEGLQSYVKVTPDKPALATRATTDWMYKQMAGGMVLPDGTVVTFNEVG